MSMKGFDVSEYQESIKWDRVPETYDFAIIRAGYGVTASQIDKKFKDNIAGAHQNGFHVGCYWFLYALTIEDAIRNAEAFLDVINPYIGKIDMPLMLDIEGDSVRYMNSCGVEPTKYLISNMIRAFCDRIEKAGFYCMVYSDNTFINTWFASDILQRYDLWFAYWVNSFDPSYCIRQCGMWQYSNMGIVDGIPGRVDLNYSFNDYPDIIKQAGLNHLDGTGPDPIPVPVTNTLIESGTVSESPNQILIVLNKKVP